MDHSMMKNLLAQRFRSMTKHNEMLQMLNLSRSIGEPDDIRRAEADYRKAQHEALEFATKEQTSAIDNCEYVGE